MTRKEELKNWASLALEMDKMRRKSCEALSEANECRKCPFWQQEDCLQVAPIANTFSYEAEDVAKMLAIGEAVAELQKLGCYESSDEDDW